MGVYDLTLTGFKEEKCMLWGHNIKVQKCACAVWLESANLRNVILSTFHCNLQTQMGLGPIGPTWGEFPDRYVCDYQSDATNYD